MKTKKRKIKNFDTYTADGTWLDFGSQVDNIKDVDIGMTCTIIANESNPGGGVPDGEYVMPDGGTWVFTSGTLTEMIEPKPESEPSSKSIVGKGIACYVISKGNFLVKVRNPNSPGKPIIGI